MSKHDDKQKNNHDLERNINSYLKKCIEGASKQYKARLFEQKKLECYLEDMEQLVVDNLGTYENDINENFSKDKIVLAEQDFENSYLYNSFILLTPKQKIVIFHRYVHELSDPYIANILGISKQAVAKKRNAALKILHSNYKK